MKNVFTVFLLVLIAQFGLAQQFADKEFYLLDSLDLSAITDEDKQFIDSALQLYHSEHVDTSKLVILESLIEDRWIEDFWLDYNQYFLNEVELQLDHSKDENVIRKSQYFKGVYNFNVGYIYENKGDSEKTLSYYGEALSYFKNIEDNFYLGDVLYMIGLVYYNVGDIDTALYCYREAINYWERVGEYDGISAVNISIGNVMSNNGFYDKALKYLNEAFIAAKKVDSYDRIGNIYVNRSIIAKRQGEFNKALLLCDSAEQHYQLINYDAGIAHVNLSLGYLYDEMGQAQNSIKCLEKSLKISKNIHHYQMILPALNKLVVLELNNKNLSKAEQYAKEIIKYKDKSYNVRFFKTSYEALSNIYTEKKDYKNALKYHKAFSALKDSIYNDEVRKQNLEITVAFEYEKQKEIDDLINSQQLQLANEQKRRTRLGMFGAVLLALITGFAAYIIFNRLKIIRQQKLALDSAYLQLEEAKKNELAVSNLKALQSQMNPHFIFNALNSVQDLVLLKDIRNSNRYLGKFSDLIRKILLSSKEQFISLEEEIEILTLYLDLEKLRFGEDFKVQLDCNVPEERQEQIKLPAMFIQPYIENAIKHGLFHKIGEKELLVSFSLYPNYLECIVKDNGIGQERAAEMKIKNLHLHTGFSTEAIAERIRLLNETLVDKIELKIEDLFDNNQPAGTKITLCFPTKNYV